MQATTSIFAQIIDKIRGMNEEQQKLLWMQLNSDSIFAEAAKVDVDMKGGLTMDEIVNITRHVRQPKKKN
jgi:hypothetical protein